MLSQSGRERIKIRFNSSIQKFEPIPLPNKDGSTTTRKVVNATFINPNPVNPDAPLKITISHQRIKANGNFEECESFNLAQLPSGKEIQMILDSEQTLALATIIQKLYEHCKDSLGWVQKTPVFTLERVDEIVKVPKGRQEVIQKLVDGNYEEEFWKALKLLNPNAADKLAHARVYETRKIALDEFKTELEKKIWNERDWQAFFERNKWIFGYGLTYKWIVPISNKFEAVSKGSSFNESGKRPDTFAKVAAEVSTTVFGDIKTPQTVLLRAEAYRSSVYIPHKEVIGGVAQIQRSIEEWIREGNTKYVVKDESGFDKEVIYTHEPKGVLVVGSLEQFKKDGAYNDDMVSSFEVYRRKTSNPEILTFDELYNRAANIVKDTNKED